jgi:serine/threonine protein kinase
MPHRRPRHRRPEPRWRLQAQERFGDSLADVVRHQYRRLADPRVQLAIVRQMVALVAELHARGVVHGDLKLANMLMEWGPLGVPTLRLCDLGAAKHMHAPAPPPGAPGAPALGGPGAALPQLQSTPYVTSRFSRAPELLAGSITYDAGVDVWSLAAAIAELYALVATLGNDACARALTGKRGGGSCQWYLDHGKPLPPVSAAQACVLFYGASGDDSQVAHIFNLLGPPSQQDIEGMRLPPDHAAVLTAIAQEVKAAAARGALAGAAGLDPAAATSANGIRRLDMAGYLNRYMFVPPGVASMLADMLKWDPRARVTAAAALASDVFMTEPAYLPALAQAVPAGLGVGAAGQRGSAAAGGSAALRMQ